MPRGGARKGAGRPTKVKAGKAETISIKAYPGQHERLKAVAHELGKTHAEVLEMGLKEAERRARAKREKAG